MLNFLRAFGEVMESSFRAYRKLHLSRSWDWFIPTCYLHLYGESGSLMGHAARRRPFGARDKYFLTLARLELHVAAIVGLVKLSG